MKRNNIKIRLLYIAIGSTMALALNYFFIEEIFIPDPCYYHSHSTSKLFDLFYSFPAYEGGHPVPSLFNLIFTALLGGIIGFGINQKKTFHKN